MAKHRELVNVWSATTSLIALSSSIDKEYIFISFCSTSSVTNVLK